MEREKELENEFEENTTYNSIKSHRILRNEVKDICV